MTKKLRIAVIAASSVVDPSALRASVAAIRKRGHEVWVHPQCKKKYFLFAGSHAERTRAFLDVVRSPKYDVIWCARGGYGSLHLLEGLKAFKKPHFKKTLVGFSDASSLLNFVNKKWSWKAVHGPMLMVPGFKKGKWNTNWTELWRILENQKPQHLNTKSLCEGKIFSSAVPLVGGNLAVISALVGTPYEISAKSSWFFLEDIGESFSRIDRMVKQLELAGSFKGIKGILLGQFEGCQDIVPKAKGKFLRPAVSLNSALQQIFAPIAKKYNIPVFFDLPCGHGRNNQPFLLGERYRISKQGRGIWTLIPV